MNEPKIHLDETQPMPEKMPPPRKLSELGKDRGPIFVTIEPGESAVSPVIGQEQWDYFFNPKTGVIATAGK